MAVDLVIKGGLVVTTEDTFECGVAVNDGKIIALAKDASLPAAEKVIDASGKVVLPGAIDAHTHWGNGGGNWRNMDIFANDARTESASAAAGGITTVFHSLWDTASYKKSIPVKNEIIRNNCVTDVAYYAVLMNLTHYLEMEDYFAQGVTSYKHFMANDFAVATDDALMHLSFTKIKALGGTAMAHCEACGPIYANLWQMLKNENKEDLAPWNDLSVLHTSTEVKKILSKYQERKDLEAWNDFRPDVMEQEGMRRAKFFGQVTGARVYVVHNTIRSGINIAGEAAHEGSRFYLETCPQYLTFTKHDEHVGVRGKVNPPLRSKEDLEALWAGIRDGMIQCMGTDHVTPMNSEHKQGDIWSVSAGFPGSETMLPVLISEGVNKRGLPLNIVARVCSYNTSRIHRIPNKGTIAPGYDADFAIVDLKKKFKVSPDMLHSSSDVTLYDGWEFTGWPVMTIVRGNIVMENSDIIAKPGFANVVKTYAAK
jgi:dihydropyrimidinase